jgi:hypothetical protein
MTEAASRIITLAGLPRSGTTWLGKIFDSHPDTVYRHEPDTARPLADVPLFVPADLVPRHREALEGFARTIRSTRTTRVSAKLPLFPKSYHGRARFLVRSALIVGIKAASRIGLDWPVPDLFRAASGAGRIWVWKSIESVGRLAAFTRCLGDSRSILLVRHPCGAAASVLRGVRGGRFGSAEATSDDEGILRIMAATAQAERRGLTFERLTAMSPVERMAWHWVVFNESAMEETADLDRCRVVRYEDLCADPLRLAREMFVFTDLGWNPQTEGFLRRSVSTDEASYYSVYKDPRKASTKWREELDPRDVRTILDIVRDSAPGRLFEADADPA